MRRRVVSAMLLATAMCVLGSTRASDTQGAAQSRYRAPDGFPDHKWGEPLSNFPNLQPEPLYVQTASSRGKTKLIDMPCVPRDGVECDLAASLPALRQSVDGEGLHALAEYYVESQGAEFPGTGALLFPLFYQFCAHWGGAVGKIPPDVRERMAFCGMRMLFSSETEKEMRAHPPAQEVVTNYDRVLRQMIKMHGEPEEYDSRGRVIIETPNETIVSTRKRPFNEWRWCSLRNDRDIAPTCEASIVLAFDPPTGWGVVLYATKPVWEFAYARHHGGAEADPLYKLLHGLSRPHTLNDSCTGSHLCRPGPPRAMSAETKALFRLPARK